MSTEHVRSNTLALAAGCFWGTEKFIVRDFQKRFPGTIDRAQVGFMNPRIVNTGTPPCYREVCSGVTGYVEVLHVELAEHANNDRLLEELFRFFFSFHDPTAKNRQGNDIGSQYASAIFYGDEDQKKIAMKVKEELQEGLAAGIPLGYQGRTVQTGVLGYSEFHPAQEEHQHYLAKNPSGYCNHRIRFTEWPTTPRSREAKKPKGWGRKVASAFGKPVARSKVHWFPSGFPYR